jgi:hypothetical protein
MGDEILESGFGYECKRLLCNFESLAEGVAPRDDVDAGDDFRRVRRRKHLARGVITVVEAAGQAVWSKCSVHVVHCQGSEGPIADAPNKGGIERSFAGTISTEAAVGIPDGGVGCIGDIECPIPVSSCHFY